ncbi:hypothetical protein [Sphingopyxis kveilinensis]|uniref:hypothetical protein n=1 Tax=Sphingopyxis kveilinensis TaxID=3114367 RepID=UPI0030D3745A
MKTNYKIIDMPTTLSRDVKIQSSNDPNKWVKDNVWYEQIRLIYSSFVGFLKKNDLLINNDIKYSDDLVVFFSDLNKDGRALIQSGADDRWLDTFDKPGGGPPPSDTSALERALQKVRVTKDDNA